MTIRELAEAFNAESARQCIGEHWRASSEVMGLTHRAATGSAIVEICYDYRSAYGSVCQWVALVWDSGVALDTRAENGVTAVIKCPNVGAPTALDAEALDRLARFAVGVLRFAPALELIAAGNAGR